MISQLRKFVHDKCEWALLPWRLCYCAYSAFLCWCEQKDIRRAQRKIDFTVERLRLREEPLRVGFYVYNMAVFQFESVFQRMLDDDEFDPYIVVTWCNLFSCESQRKADWAIHKRSVEELSRRYGAGRVFDSYEGNIPRDFSGRFDICATMRPYDRQLIEPCKISYLARKGIPVMYAHYGFEGGDVADKGVFNAPAMRYLWRFYTGNPEMKVFFERLHPSAAKKGSVVLSGNPKFEQLAYQERRVRTRKCVIVAPHHTIDPKAKFHLSNFVRLSEFLVSLPCRYPNIDWVFRPHPNLMPRMISSGRWTQDECVRYMGRWRAYPNAIVQEGGDYYDVFVNSDALIQDCSSFLAEYHVTGHPQCYILKSEEHAATQYFGLGKRLLDHAYKCFDEKDILDFIDNVVVNGNDSMRDERENFLSQTILMNYPHVSDAIIRDIINALRPNKSSRHN